MGFAPGCLAKSLVEEAEGDKKLSKQLAVTYLSMQQMSSANYLFSEKFKNFRILPCSSVCGPKQKINAKLGLAMIHQLLIFMR